jgi:type I restriction enzyme S subunit
MSNSIPSDWELSTLESSALLITDGAHASPPTCENGRPIATVQNMRSRAIDVASCRLISVDDFDALVKGNCAPEIGDVLFSKDGTVGKTFVYRQTEKVVLLSSIAIIRLCKFKLDPEFCSQFLLSPLFYREMENTKSGSAIRRIVLNDLKKIELPKPPLHEQQKIASILSSVDDVIEKTRAQIDKLKDLKTGMMQELLTKGFGLDGKPHTEFKDSPVGRIPATWEVDDLIALSTNGISNGVFNDPKKVGRGKKIINVYDMYQGFGVDISTLKLLDVKDKEFTRNKVEYGDIFFTRSSLKLEGIAYCNINLSNDDDITYDGHLMRIRPDQGRVNPKYLAHYCLADHSRKFFMAAAKHSTMTTIGQADIAPLKVALPPLSEQQNIVAVIDSIETKTRISAARLQQVVTLKKALMQDLLTGKVRVNIDNKEPAVA